MNSLFQHISMKHLMLFSVGMFLLGIVWLAVVWTSSIDKIWLVPGVFLIISAITKMIAVQVWMKVAKIGTPDHKPIKAL